MLEKGETMDPNSVLEESQRKAAKIAGLAILTAILVVIVGNYGCNFRLIIPDNAVETARNILAHETLFRFNVALNLVYVLCLAGIASALYVLLRPVNHTLSLIAALSRVVLALMWCVLALNCLGALRILGNTTYLKVMDTAQLQALARLNLASGHDAYYVGLPFWAIASTICSCLFFVSRYIPKGLAVAGILSSAWCVFCAFSFVVFPSFGETVNASWFDMPMLLFEIVLGFWLLFKKIRLPSPVGHVEQPEVRA